MKFSIITPTCNSERFLKEAIESVITQKGDFSIEYIIVDNCSKDQTERIVKQFQDAIKKGDFKSQCNDIQLHFIQEPDTGMYDAIQKGFSRASGDIFAWINSDDIYLEGAFDQVYKVFAHYPEVNWLQGRTIYVDQSSKQTSRGPFFLYDQNWIRKGLYGPVLFFIHQPSCFWRSNLWGLGHEKFYEYSLAGDYYLWRQFAKNEPLYSINVFLSCFRKVPGQKSENAQAYWDELVQKKNIDRRFIKILKIYFKFETKLPLSIASVFRKLILGKQTFQFFLIGEEALPQLYRGEDHDFEKYL